jgi:hypothetical protein
MLVLRGPDLSHDNSVLAFRRNLEPLSWSASFCPVGNPNAALPNNATLARQESGKRRAQPALSIFFLISVAWTGVNDWPFVSFSRI